MPYVRPRKFQLASLGGIGLLVLTLIFSFTFFRTTSSPSVKAAGPVTLAAKGELRPAVLKAGNVSRTLPFFSAGILNAANDALAGNSQKNGQGSLLGLDSSLGCSLRNPFHDGSSRVNQDCTYRRQAEESIAANPINSNNLIGGQNDSRIGFNHCGFDYSLDGGHRWGDGLPPFWQRFNNPPAGHTILGGTGTNHTYDFASDPGVTFDSQGNAFFSCVVLDVNDAASALLVTASPAAAHGSFYNNVPSTGSTYVVVEDNSPLVSHDKPFIRADSFPGSPFRDRVYAVWTVFRFSPQCGPQPNPGQVDQQCSSPIFFSYSADHAVTWSRPIEISGTSPLCFFGNALDPTRPANACDLDQGADPIVLPNGRVVVTFNNGNTAANNPNAQQLAVYSDDGGVTWSNPVLVGPDIVVGEPQCDFGRGPEECVPGPFIRTNDFPRIAVDRSTTKNLSNLYVVWQDYKSGHEYDIEIAQSMDGGQTWTGANSPVNPSTGLDHYMPAVDVVSASSSGNIPGSHVAVSYYRSPQPSSPQQDGTLGQDYDLAGGFGLATPYHEVKVAPLTPPPDGNQAGFNGDYSGLVVVGKVAHPIWSDTRNSVPASVNTITNQGVANDEDVFTRTLLVP